MGYLKVGVVGAGIGGLAAAVALRRAGHEVEVFEQSEFKSEVGAAIAITPNGSWVLEDWGIHASEIGGVVAEGARVVNGKTLESMFSIGYDARRHGQPLWCFHRVDLHRKLREIFASQNSQQGPPGVIRLGNKIKDVDCDQGSITLVDGTVVEKDLVVVADGVRSHFLDKFTDQPASIYSNGMSAFRALIPFTEIDKMSEIRGFFKDPPSDFWAAANLDPDYRKRTTIVTYPCRNGEILNMVLLHATRSDQPEEDDWHSDAPTQAVLEVISDFHPSIQSLVKLAPEVKVYTLLQRTPLDRLSHGKAVILGDAAALYQPKTSQGGTIALESAAALEHIFAGASPEQVTEKASLYNEFMHPHVLTIQLWSDWVPAMGRNKIRQRLEEVSMKPLPSMDASEFSQPVQDYLYDYNVIKEVKEFLSRRDQQKGHAAQGTDVRLGHQEGIPSLSVAPPSL